MDEFICAINTDTEREQTVWVTVDTDRHPPEGEPLVCLYSTDRAAEKRETAPPTDQQGSAVQITVPPGGVVIYR